MAERNTLRITAGKRGWIIPVLLIISLTANILGLLLPFLEIDEAFHDKVIYSLPHSVELMWEHKLYFIAILILICAVAIGIFLLIKRRDRLTAK